MFMTVTPKKPLFGTCQVPASRWGQLLHKRVSLQWNRFLAGKDSVHAYAVICYFRDIQIYSYILSPFIVGV